MNNTYQITDIYEMNIRNFSNFMKNKAEIFNYNSSHNW
jgi:hypothetical protein